MRERTRISKDGLARSSEGGHHISVPSREHRSPGVDDGSSSGPSCGRGSRGSVDGARLDESRGGSFSSDGGLVGSSGFDDGRGGDSRFSGGGRNGCKGRLAFSRWSADEYNA